MSRIGVLALQGDFSAHTAVLLRMGLQPQEIRRTSQLRNLQGLILPGGESTTLLRLMQHEPWFEALREFHDRGGALFGTCAGAILLAGRVTGPEQPSLGLLDAVVRRNAYGRQVDSFEKQLHLAAGGRPLRAIFIRAPRLESLGPGVELLAADGEVPVLVREGRILACTFHPELAGEERIHRYFAEQVMAGSRCDPAESQTERGESHADLPERKVGAPGGGRGLGL